MKVLILYRPVSESARGIEEFIRNLQALHGGQRLEVLDYDSREGSATASLYDLVTHPAILVIQEDGSLQKSWEGDNLPLIDEVVAYART